ncbi:MAG: PD-(D/E)XK nuclease family protein [Chlorobi bacterium]|nr:PD-(D/E)XK nuclease family protein [Chlorobiota bacterium]
MTPFLKKLSEELLAKYGNDISRICIVFPSRRAGIYFKKYLAELLDKPVWSPQVLGIQDFIAELSPYQISDRLTLIFELYEIYRRSGDPDYTSFDKFYPWGVMLLNDFDEIDKNLAESEHLFKILREHRKIEGEFEFKVSDIEEFNKFWDSFSSRKLSMVHNEFIRTWEIIGKVYHKFRKTLLEKSIAYEGMAYRRIYELIRTGEIKFKWKKIIFAGFNLLTKAEEGIIEELLKENRAETYWDADEYYLKSELQEGGHFLRENFLSLNLEKPKWTIDELSKGKKNIKIIGAPLQITQAKVLGNELKNLKPGEISKSAVVLPDENLLLPVLLSIPENIDSFNITMGFPVKNSSIYTLLHLLKSLQKNKKVTAKQPAFYHKDVIQILIHPYIKFLAAGGIYRLVNEIKKRNIVYISREKIISAFEIVPELISEIFSAPDTVKESLNYLYKMVELISQKFDANRNASKFEAEYLFSLYTELNRLNDILGKYSPKIEIDTFWKMICEVLALDKIPFTGEPLKGMQIMGLLETRLLDFDNVYILSMNEDIMPRGNSQSSFIPYNLRKAFKLPTYEDDDSTYAYYFYRLIQRAKNICLIYNTEPGEILAGEKSRFLMQIEKELAEENPSIKLENLILQSDASLPKRKKITVSKSSDIIESLKKLEHISVSRLINYINCPLQFYLRTIAKLKEEESVDEYLTGAGFGNILHKITELLYTDYKGKAVDKNIICGLKKTLDNNYDILWEKACRLIPELEEFKASLQGKNLLYKNVIKKLIDKILDNDINEAPFTIISLENNLSKELEINLKGEPLKVKLLGRLDRIEEKDGVLRIIDYKTGQLKKPKQQAKETMEEHMDRIFEDIDYKEHFQQLFYAFVYLDSGDDKDLVIGVYPIRDLSSGIYWFEEEPIVKEKTLLFENKLKGLLEKIFDSATPFTQTDEIERCKYCDYKSICYRD